MCISTSFCSVKSFEFSSFVTYRCFQSWFLQWTKSNYRGMSSNAELVVTTKDWVFLPNGSVTKFNCCRLNINRQSSTLVIFTLKNETKIYCESSVDFNINTPRYRSQWCLLPQFSYGISGRLSAISISNHSYFWSSKHYWRSYFQW